MILRGAVHASVMEFLEKPLKLTRDTVCHLPLSPPSLRTAVAPDSSLPSIEHFKQKEVVKSQGRELKAEDLSVNDQFPKVML